MIFIAEVKTKSPFGFIANKSWDELFDIANLYGNFLSIHVDEKWGGSQEVLRKAKSLTSIAILAKGIHSTDDQIVESLVNGANYVLVVGRLPRTDLLQHCFIEPLNLAQLSMVPPDVT